MGYKIFLNGEFVDNGAAKISVFDHGLLYGDGVFEGIRSYNRKVFCLDEHLDRMFEGAAVIRLKMPYAKKEFRAKILETLKVNELDNAYIRAVVTRGPGDLGLDPRKCKEPTVFVIAHEIVLYPKEFYENGLPIIIAKTRRTHPHSLDPRVKSLNYLNNILGKIEAIDSGTHEALMLTVDGYVAECTGDNVFVIKEGKLLTPPNEIGALSGITQKSVIELAKKRGMEFAYKMMSPEDVVSAEECFLTGTAAEVIPVTKVDNKVVGNGAPGAVTKLLMQDFKELVKREGVSY